LFKHRAQAFLENKGNSGFNELLEGERPAVLVVEELRHVFTFDNQREMNRRLSLWAKGIIQDRAELEAQAGGSGLKQVNCAYGSQRCPECGFLGSRNRAGVLTLPSGLAPETVASIMKEWESLVLRSAKTAPERTVSGRTADTESRQQSDVVGDASRSVAGCSRPVTTTSVNRRANLPLPGSSCS
jgi:hypothetical protein